MTSRFAALCSDSDSDDDSHASPNIKPSVVPVAPPPIQRSYVQPEQHYQQQSSYQDHYQQQSSYQQFNAPQPVVEDAGFKAVPKKKSMKAQKITDLPEKMGANALLAEEIRNDARAAEKSAGYGGNAGHTVSGGGHYGAGGGHGEYVGNGGQMAGGANVYSQFSGGVPAGNGHMGTSPVKGGKPTAGVAVVAPREKVKVKRKAGGAFAALAGDDEDEEEEEEEYVDQEEYYPIQESEPVLPKQMGMLPQNAMPEYLAVVHMEATRPFEEREATLKKPFKPEVISFSVSFLHSQTKRVEHSFERFVSPSEFPQLSKKTLEDTGITGDEPAQPLDEVFREMERWTKEKNLVSINRNKKRGGTRLSGGEQEFCVVVDGLSFLKDVFRPEVVRKNITVPSMFKKFLDIKALFSENYKLAKDASLSDMLTSVCLDFQGVPNKDEPKNIVRLLQMCMDDCPGKVVPNASDKDFTPPPEKPEREERGGKGKGKRRDF